MHSFSQETSSLMSRRLKTNDASNPSFLTKYFMVIMFLFACMLIGLNSRFTDTVLHSTMKEMELTLQASLGTPSVPNEPSGSHTAVQQPVESAASTIAPRGDATTDADQHGHRLAGLNCEPWGGPSNDVAQEMVYWEDIPTDAHHVSPFQKPGISQYMTFEPDSGGWNNIRMAMETLLVCTFLWRMFLIWLGLSATWISLDKPNRQLRLLWAGRWFCLPTSRCTFSAKRIMIKEMHSLSSIFFTWSVLARNIKASISSVCKSF